MSDKIIIELTVDEARKYLACLDKFQGGYVHIDTEFQTAVLDGNFSLDELKAIVVLIENKATL